MFFVIYRSFHVYQHVMSFSHMRGALVGRRTTAAMSVPKRWSTCLNTHSLYWITRNNNPGMYSQEWDGSLHITDKYCLCGKYWNYLTKTSGFNICLYQDAAAWIESRGRFTCDTYDTCMPSLAAFVYSFFRIKYNRLLYCLWCTVRCVYVAIKPGDMKLSTKDVW